MSRLADGINQLEASIRQGTSEAKRPPRIVPTQGRVVIEPLDDDTAGASGLILAGRDQMRAQMGRIAAVAPPLDPTIPDEDAWQVEEEYAEEFNVGDIVLFGPNAGHSIDVGYGHARVRCLIMRTIEILAKVEQDDA